jgi:hypothetical protein
MRKVGDLMKELGFNKDAPVETQKAFIRHLVKAAEQSVPRQPAPAKEVAPSTEPIQLSFDATALGVVPDEPHPKKTGTSRR